MSRRIFISLLVVLAFCLAQTALVMADDTKPASAGESGKMPPKPGIRHRMASNVVAVCECGKVFVPNASTKFVEYNGKTYACCSDECHEKAMKDPAAAAKATEDQVAKLTGQESAPGK